MNYTSGRFTRTAVAALVLLALFLVLTLPSSGTTGIAFAQEVTEEPTSSETTPVPTEAAPVTPESTVAETAVTPVPEVSETPQSEVTDEPAVVETALPEVTAEPEITDEPAVEPVTPVVTPLPTLESPFSDNFENGAGEYWVLNGWSLASDENGQYLASELASATASIATLDWADLEITARVKVDTGNTLSIYFRSGDDFYRMMLDAFGNTRLYRGGAILDASAVPAEAPTEEPDWYTVTVRVVGATTSISVDAVEKLTYQDAEPLTAGFVVFGSGESNTGIVAIDDVIITELTADAEMPEVPTEVATEPVVEETPIDAPEITPEVETTPVAELTPEVEITPEVEVTEPVADVRETAPIFEPQVLVSDDFEADLSAWQTATSIVVASEGNHAVMMPANSTLVPAVDTSAAQLEVAGLLNIVTAAEDGSPTGLSVVLSASEGATFTANVGVNGASLVYSGPDGDILLAESAIAHAPNSWINLSAVIDETTITVSVNNVVELSYTSETPLSAGPVAFAAASGSSIMLDDIVVTDLAPDSPPEMVEPTTLPTQLTAETEAKVIDDLRQIVTLHNEGDAEGVQALLSELNVEIDDTGRLMVVIWTSSTSDAVEPIVTSYGGSIISTSDYSIKAFMPLEYIVALVNEADVSGVQLPDRASPTGTVGAPNDAPIGTVVSEGFDLVGAQDWHLAGITGTGIKIGVIDIGFSGIADAGERSCLANALVHSPAPYNTLGGSNHGVNMVEVICDVSPGAQAYMYRANDYQSLGAAINAAIGDGMRIIVIGLDLGTHASPGDGTLGRNVTDTDNPYAMISQARSNGIIVIAAAGNNTGRSTAFTLAGGIVNVPIAVTPGETINVSWSAPNWENPTARPNFNLTGAGLSKSNPSSGPAGYQFTTTGCSGNPCNVNLAVSGSAGIVVQVQVTGDNSSLTPPAQHDATMGNLARPADSKYAIAVGAVCMNPVENYPLAGGSSHGPIYGANGTAYQYDITDDGNVVVKPDILSASNVSTSLLTSDVLFDEDCDIANVGFSGTSAAAAHVAGMVALMMDNGDTNASMEVFTFTNSSAFTEVKRYLQTHTTDMPFGVNVDSGFDFNYGAGLAILGSPTYNFADAINYATPAVNVDANGDGTSDCTADFIYVGQGEPTDAATGAMLQDGSITNPWAHPAKGLAEVDQPGDCVIVMPGEYMTPLLVNGVANGVTLTSYDGATAIDYPDSYFYVNALYTDPVTRNNGGVYFNNGLNSDTTPIAVNGFVFIPSQIYTPYGTFPEPQAVTFEYSDYAVISNSVFNNFSLKTTSIISAFDNGVTDASSGVMITGNEFIGNQARANLPLLIDIADSGVSAPIQISQNVFEDNDGGYGTFDDWMSLIRSVDSEVDILSNVFYNNRAQTLVQTKTTSSASVLNSRVMGNLFQENVSTSNVPPGAFGATESPGPMINVYYNQNFYFINNTVIGNDLTAATGLSAILARGDADITSSDGSLVQADANWEIHNNLIYQNTLSAQGVLVRDTNQALGIQDNCRHIQDTTPFPQTDDDRGATNNWIIDNIGAGGNGFFGSCGYVIASIPGTPPAGNPNTWNNNLAANLDPWFLGNQPDVTLEEPWYFYALTSDVNAILSPAIDQGDNNAGADANGGTPLIGVQTDINGNITQKYLLHKDVRGEARVTDGDRDDVLFVDIGAFEYSPITIQLTEGQDYIDYNFEKSVTFYEDGEIGGLPYIFELADRVEGGFGTITFAIDDNDAQSIDEFPANYGTYCTPSFGGTRGILIDSSTGVVQYCPPRDFYADGTAGIPSDVSFILKATDSSGASAIGEVRFTIDPRDDDLLIQNSTIGDAQFGDGGGLTPDPGDLFEATLNINTDTTLQLRPYVTFNNFRFSESKNTEFSNRVDYPFTYSNVVLADDPDGIIDSFSPNAGGQLDITVGGKTGTATFTYTVSDARAGSTDNNTLRIYAVSRIPSDGLFDDTSFAFEYTDIVGGAGSWEALHSDGNINNSLHQTRTAGDVAQFQFIGRGFVLYMESGSGDQWELKIDDTSAPGSGWTPVADSPGVYETTFTLDAGTAHCTTKQNTSGASILTVGKGSYTVSCNKMIEGTHTVQVVNLGTRRYVQVDAFSIIKERNADDLLQPGFHDVDEEPLQDEFLNATNWTPLLYSKATRGIAMEITGAGAIPDTADVTFAFKGATGFAIGTVLEPFGASYTICVENTLTPDPINIPTTPEVCQSYDNALGLPRETWQAYRPFYGLDPTYEYEVTVKDIVLPTDGTNLGRMVFDSLTLFSDTATGPLGLGTTDDSSVEKFIFGNGQDDSWSLDTNNKKVVSNTLTSMAKKVTEAGPYVGFRIPGDADTLYWQRDGNIKKDSGYIMICVDRGLGIGADQHGNCIVVNLQADNLDPASVKYWGVETDGTWTSKTAVTDIVRPVDDTIVITEANFRGGDWGAASEHVVEMFSLTAQAWNFDNVTVLSSTGALVEGHYEEYFDAITYYDYDSGVFTPFEPIPYDRYTNKYIEEFTVAINKDARQDSGEGVVQTAGLNNAIYFQIEGTGFAPLFRTGKTSDAVKVCWLDYAGVAPAVDDVLATGECQIFDNQNKSNEYQVLRSIQGLKKNTYAVAIQILDDNFIDLENVPAPHTGSTLPVEMWFDGVRVFDDDLDTLVDLTPGQRYEGSYINSELNNQFLYQGEDWKTNEGNMAKKQSGDEYDIISKTTDASITFFTDEADAVIFYRDTKKNYAPMLVCAAEDTGGSTYVNRHCSIISNEGKANQDPVTFYLTDNPFETGTPGRYIVTLTLLNDGNFVFDAVEPVDATAFGPGEYQETTPGIVANDSYANLVPNGGMEVDNTVDNIYWDDVNTVTHIQGTVRYEGSKSRSITTGAVDSGIQSKPFTLTNGDYTGIARVFVPTLYDGDITYRLMDGATPLATKTLTLYTLNIEQQNRWITLRFDYTHNGGTIADAHVEIISSEAGVSFYTDDIRLTTGGSWIVETTKKVDSGTLLRSTTHGASLEFFITNATGFEIGTVLDKTAGAVEICYGVANPATNAFTGDIHCSLWENEAKKSSYTTSRTFAGLNASNIYKVTMSDMEDGVSVIGRDPAFDPRNSKYAVGNILLDYVTVFNETAPPVLLAGTYNEDYVQSGENGLQLLPADGWISITGSKASKFSQSSYFTLIDERGKSTRNFAGPMGVIQITVPASGAAFSIDVNNVANSNSDQLLVCVGPVEGEIYWNAASEQFEVKAFDATDAIAKYDTDNANNCAIANLQETQKPVFTSADIDLLGLAGTYTLTFRTLTPGQFNVDGYQVLYGTAMTEGFYEETIGDDVITRTGTWTSSENKNYSGGTASVSDIGAASISFNLVDSTGFSLITEYGATRGPLTVDVTQTGCTTCYIDSLVINTFNSRSYYEAAATVAGLPYGNYTVTITNDGTSPITHDAIRVYGELQELGSLWDDAQTDSNGDMIFTYGPDVDSWIAEVGRRARGTLNETYHETSVYGGSTSFIIGDGAKNVSGKFILYAGSRSNSTIVNVCWTNLSNAQRECKTISLAGGGEFIVSPPTFTGGTGAQFAVSVTNEEFGKKVQFDAVQVLESTTQLFEGIYNVEYLDDVLTTSAFTSGSWLIDTTKNTAIGGVGSVMQFQFTGIGFSLLIDEVGADQYTVCVETGGGCNIINETVIGGSGDRALTYMGLHNGAGNDATYTVRITNSATNGRDMIITGVHVIAADASLIIDNNLPVENTDPQLQYLPFGSLVDEVSRRTGPSGMSQHVGTLNGSVIYFEYEAFDFDGDTGTKPSFEYIRELASSNGNVEVCYGEIGGTNTLAGRASNMHCEGPIDNTGKAYQAAIGFTPDDNGIDCTTNGCWVSIENLDGRKMMVDVVRLFDPTFPISADGYYEQTHPSLLFNGIFTPEYEDRKASGGTVAYTETPGDTLFFKMSGVGFSVHFTMDRYTDAVNVCWLKYDSGVSTPADAAAVLSNPATLCETFDNESNRTQNNAARTVLGLDPNTYAVAVEMLDDQYNPKQHTRLPLSMKIDGVSIYSNNHEWLDTSNWSDTSALNILVPGVRYETNYANSVEAKNFVYVGSDWETISGSKAKNNSNLDYDVVGETGAGVLFRTDNANAVTLYRNTKKGYAPIQVCSAPVVNNTPWEVDLSAWQCTIVSNEATGTQQPYSVQFNTDGSTGPHMVSITTLDYGNFELDSIEVYAISSLTDDTGTNALTEGLYEANSASIVYDADYANLIVDGDMEAKVEEVDNRWVNITGLVPDINEQYSRTKYTNKYSRRVVADPTEGIQYRDTVTLLAGETYTITARVYAKSGSVTMEMDTQSAKTTFINDWETLKFVYTPSVDTDVTLRFVASTDAGSIVEFYVDDISITTGGTWQQLTDKKASEDASLMLSQTHGASASFVFEGTGFQIGTVYNKDGGEVKVCYGAPTDYPTNWDINANCFTYEHEYKSNTNNVAHFVTGLASDVYLVTITDVEDGLTVLGKTTPDSRDSKYSVGKIGIDYIRIYGDVTPPEVAAGYYDDRSVDENGDLLLQLYPFGGWGYEQGTSKAKSYYSTSFTFPADSRGRQDSKSANANATLDLVIPADSGSTTFVGYTATKTSKRFTSQLLVCADEVTGDLSYDGTEGFTLENSDTCHLVTTLPEATYFMVDGGDIPALNSSPTEKIVTLSIQLLTPGQFSLDGYEFMHGDVLWPGIHDEFLPESLLNFASDLNEDLKSCDEDSEWCLAKAPKGFGGFIAETADFDATLTFNVQGTGFSVITETSNTGADFRICYKQSSNGKAFPDASVLSVKPENNLDKPTDLDDPQGDGIFCETFTTNLSSWDTINVDRIKPKAAGQYGFSYYGLPFDEYNVEVRLVDTNLGLRDTLAIDAIAVFSDISSAAPLTEGIYDNTENSINYEPEVFWSDKTAKSGPPKGPYMQTETVSSNAGNIMQVRVQGNTVVLFQTADPRSSKDLQICVTVTTDVIHCGDFGEQSLQALQVGEFAQYTKRRAYFSPIVFYGLGEGAHPIIIENRDHGATFGVDAIMIPE